MDEEGIYGLLENPRTLYSPPIHFPYLRSQNLITVVWYIQELARRMGEDEGQLSPPLRSSAALVTDTLLPQQPVAVVASVEANNTPLQ